MPTPRTNWRRRRRWPVKTGDSDGSFRRGTNDRRHRRGRGRRGGGGKIADFASAAFTLRLLPMQPPQPASGNFWKRYPPGIVILGGWPILAITLLFAFVFFGDYLPTDYDGRPLGVLGLPAGIIIISVPILFFIRGFVPLFSKRASEAIKRHKRIDNLWAIAVIIFSLTFNLSLFVTSTGQINPKSPMGRKWKTEIVISQVYAGIFAYKTDYGSLPPTSNNRDLIKILTGDNPQKTEYVPFNSWATNAAGEAIDGWETPLRVNLTDPKKPMVQSAGRDRIWDTPDDLTEKDDPYH